MSTTKPKSNTTPPPENGNPRPLPDFPRRKARRVYALVVGINEYASGIPNLSGCLNDVELVTNYLRDEFGIPGSESVIEENKIPAHKKGGTELDVEVNGRLHLCTLTNEQATYWNIIQVFEQHLSRAKSFDTIWFHFSGHGSEQFSAEKFNVNDPNWKDQTLVCYKADDDHKNQLFLADKEIAALLNKVAKPDKEEKPELVPHIVVSIDACHSGSGTRDGDIEARVFKFLTAEDREDPSLLPGSVRELHTYYGGYLAMDVLSIPTSKHILLAACESTQTAGEDLFEDDIFEDKKGILGIFTKSLIDVLKDNEQPLSYARLFAETRTKASKKRPNQNPQFETAYGFNPFTRFLEGTPMPDTVKLYEVKKTGNDWMIHCGAINGLPVNTGSDEFIRILIDTENTDEEGNSIMVEAFIDLVGAQHSRILPEEIEAAGLDPEQNYFASIITLPVTPIFVKLEGEESTVNALQDKWDSSKSVLLATTEEEAAVAAVLIEASEANGFIIKETASGRTFIEIPEEAGDVDVRIDHVLSNISKIANWMRTIELDNPNTEIRDFYDFELVAKDKDGVEMSWRDKEIEIVDAEGVIELSSQGNLILPTNFKITFQSDQQDLFVYPFTLRENCEIRYRDEGKAEALQSESISVGDSMLLLENDIRWGMAPDDTYATYWFKLFIATEEIDAHQLEQTGLILDRDIEETPVDLNKISNDWCTETIKVTVRKQTETV